MCETAFWFGAVLQAPVGAFCASRAPAPSGSRVAARAGSELEIVANHGLCLMRQILLTMTPAAAEIRVTRIKALPRVPYVFGT